MVRVGCFALLAATSACDVHDASLLDDVAPRVTPVREAQGGAATPDAPDAPDSADAGRAMPEPSLCGDGRVGPDEMCDIGIAAGMPGACPGQVCEPLSECQLRARRGDGCQAACVLLPEACAGGDRCCPASCTAESDSDCSASCGDGVVQAEQETCEDGSDTPCPSDGDCDDADPCTEDVLVGSADNCNAVCENRPITTLSAGDACCPDGANANTDADCVAMCGNGIREGDEECDGTDGCDGACMLSETPQQLDCIDRLADDACLACACVSCTTQVFDCYESGNAVRDMHCSTINQCARDNDCVGTACYCGESCIVPNGACVTPIHDAAPLRTPLSVQSEEMNPDSAIGRAMGLSECAVTNCADVCP